SGGADGDLQSDGPVAHGNAVPHAEKLGRLALELLDKRPVVREPPAVQHLIDAHQQAVAVADVGPADVNGWGEQGRSPQHGKLRKVAFHWVRGRLLRRRRVSTDL